MQFEWDTEKEKINLEKHGVDFQTMKKDKMVYSDAPQNVATAIEEGAEVSWKKIEQMLEMPTTQQLAKGIRTRKTSISLTELTIDKFKQVAQEENVSYQQLIREVLHWYALNYLEG